MRNNLNTDTVSAIVTTKQTINEAGGILTFNPSKEMLCAKIW
jgi:hypothetical protein